MPHNSVRLILLIFAFGLLAGGCLGKAILVAPALAHLLALGKGELGWIVSSTSAAALIVAPFGGWLIDRFGDKRILVASLLLTAATSFASTRAGSFNTMLAIRIIEGVGYTGIVISGTTLMIRATDGARRAGALSLWACYAPLGVGICLLLGTALSSQQDWRDVFYLHSILLLGSILTIPALPPIPQRADGPSSAVEIRRGATSLPVVAIGIAFGLTTFVQGGMVAASPLYLTTARALPLSEAAGFGALMPIGAVLGSLIAASLTGRGVSLAKVAVVAIGLAAVAGALIFIPTLDLLSFRAAIFAFAIGGGLLFSLLTVNIARVASSKVIGTSTGVINQISHIGSLLGPPAFFSLLNSDWRLRAATIVAACALTYWFGFIKNSPAMRSGS